MFAELVGDAEMFVVIVDDSEKDGLDVENETVI
jgi:hypothetical protein